MTAAEVLARIDAELVARWGHLIAEAERLEAEGGDSTPTMYRDQAAELHGFRCHQLAAIRGEVELAAWVEARRAQREAAPGGGG